MPEMIKVKLPDGSVKEWPKGTTALEIAQSISPRLASAALVAQDCIKSVEVLEYPELGMEAVWKIQVEDFPAFVVVDDKGNDFFTDTAKPVPLTVRRRS